MSAASAPETLTQGNENNYDQLPGYIGICF